jgi:hypothetical protein
LVEIGVAVDARHRAMDRRLEALGVDREAAAVIAFSDASP